MTDQFSTRAVHAGEDKRKPFGALTTPIVQTSTLTFADSAEILDFVQRKGLASQRFGTSTGATATPPTLPRSSRSRPWKAASGPCSLPAA